MVARRINRAVIMAVGRQVVHKAFRVFYGEQFCRGERQREGDTQWWSTRSRTRRSGEVARTGKTEDIHRPSRLTRRVTGTMSKPQWVTGTIPKPQREHHQRAGLQNAHRVCLPEGGQTGRVNQSTPTTTLAQAINLDYHPVGS
jgi:hypothetical protein